MMEMENMSTSGRSKFGGEMTLDQMAKLFDDGVAAGEKQAITDMLNNELDETIDTLLEESPNYKDPYDVGFRLGYLAKAM